MTKLAAVEAIEKTDNQVLDLVISPRSGLARGVKPPDRKAQELWFSLARRKWSVVVLVPADEETSVGNVANSLAEVGRWLRDGSVSAIVDHPLDAESAMRLASIIEATRQGNGAPLELIIAIRPVVTEPLGLAVAWAADAVVLCVEKNRTRVSSARRTIELIGSQRVTSCILV